MSILVKGIEKPNSCAICPFERDGFPDEWEMHCLLLHRKVGYYGNNLRMPTSCPIVEVPTPNGRSKWIPCKDRLPERTRKSYWVCTDAGSQHECRWTNNRFGLRESDEWGWSIFDIPQYTKVVAWMPLPEPYEEHSMEEFMYGQDPGDPEDGSL